MPTAKNTRTPKTAAAERGSTPDLSMPEPGQDTTQLLDTPDTAQEQDNPATMASSDGDNPMPTAKKTSAGKTAAKKTTASKSAAKSPAKKAAGKTAAPKQLDATALLRADHKKVSDLFDAYEKTRSANRKRDLVETICAELTVHTQIEEEIFYPAVKAALKDKELVPEATVEHASVKDLIEQVRGKMPDGEMFDAKVKVMSEFVKHHVKEEQNEMFPRAKKTKLDMMALGAQMQARKDELMSRPML